MFDTPSVYNIDNSIADEEISTIMLESYEELSTFTNDKMYKLNINTASAVMFKHYLIEVDSPRTISACNKTLAQ